MLFFYLQCMASLACCSGLEGTSQHYHRKFSCPHLLTQYRTPKICRLHLAACLKEDLTQVLYESLSCPHTGSYSGLYTYGNIFGFESNFVEISLTEDTCLRNDFHCPLQEAKARKGWGHKWGHEGHVRPDITGRTASAKLTQNY